MTNAVTTKSANAVGALDDLVAGLVNVQAHMPSATSDPFLRLLTDGHWVYGPSDTEVEDESLWAIDPRSLQHGKVSWTNNDKEANSIVGEVMVPSKEPLPSDASLPESATPYKKQYSCLMACVKGEDKGTQVLYKTTATGGIRALDKIIVEVVKHIKEEDPTTPIPVIELGVDFYKHKQYGKTYFPEFNIADWVALDATEINETDEEEEVEEKPKRSRRRS